MIAAIKAALQAIEHERDIHILYACEAGSRAWGIESANSDYDVRFLYVHPRERYLSLDTPRDVIELPVINDLDINGWDTYKALRLLRKGNPTLLEWLFSPTIYVETSPSIEEMRRLARSLIAPRVSLHYHYEHVALGHYRQYIKGKSPVLSKKYLYVLRPLIMLMYLDRHGVFPLSVSFPPLLFDVGLSDEVRGRICALILRKQAGEELGMSTPDEVLNAFTEERLEHWKTQTFGDTYDHSAMQRETATILRTILDEEK